MADNPTDDTMALDSGTYEIIQGRLLKQKNDLQQRLNLLNEARKGVFGSLETQLIANDRINTENNCIARDIVSIGNQSLFGYNVHFGLRTSISLSDVFSVYQFQKEGDTLGFKESSTGLDLIDDPVFKNDFENLYKYYRNTIFSKFAVIGNYLYMVFQLSESVSDIKTFKWLINGNTLEYVDNRSDHEYQYPEQYDFIWTEAGRDNQRHGTHAHVSILDKVFVETIGGDLTIKVEDNTDNGKGIYNEDVQYKDQTLDDGQFRYADLGNLVVLEIKPFQEDPRYFVYNHKLKVVEKIDSIAQSAVLLPDDQGIIFPSGYYLQTGEYNVFSNNQYTLKFQQKITSPNGEDHLYIFYDPNDGVYVLMSYNVIDQEVKTPIVCNGFTILEEGELCYFRTENEQTKHHMMQIWQTPYLKGDIMPSEHQDTLLYKIGNKDIVKAMAETNELITLLNKQDSYDGLYDDIARASKDILDAYYWIGKKEAHELTLPLNEINKASNAAIDEFEKVKQLRRQAEQETIAISKKSEELFSKIKSTSFKSINDFVDLLTQLRTIRGEAIGLYEVRYVDHEFIKRIEAEIVEQNETISRRATTFLLNDKALEPYHKAIDEKQQALNDLNKVIDIKALEKEVNQIATDLELLIDIVSNLDIEDTSHSTKIIENISLIFATINQVKAAIKNKLKAVGKKEAQADFTAQLKLIDQSIINYIDIANTPEKCDEFLTKVSIQLEELEGKFSDFEEYITQVIEKREEVYAAFDNRKSSLIEARNKKTVALQNAAQRIIKGGQKKAQSFDSITAINGYFASDLMINKVRDIIVQLKELGDIGKSEAIETALKVAREDALRKLKDKTELYEDGDSIIKLGKHKFGVNKQQLDITIVFKNDELYYHLTGTDFYQKLDHEVLNNSKDIWEQELISEDQDVYRAAYLAYTIFSTNDKTALRQLNDEALLAHVQDYISGDYLGGYVKGVHDYDATQFLKVLLQKHKELGLLIYPPNIRAEAQFFWNALSEEHLSTYNRNLKSAGEVLAVFPKSKEYNFIIDELALEIQTSRAITDDAQARHIAQYLFDELKDNDTFTVSNEAITLKNAFEKELATQKAASKFKQRLNDCATQKERIELVKHWVSAFAKANQNALVPYVSECVASIIYKNDSATNTVVAETEIKDLKGVHSKIKNGSYAFNYHTFSRELNTFNTVKVPAFSAFKAAKHEVIEQLKDQLRLDEFKPRVLSSFVRNKLINQVYFPLIGDNLTKQLGTVGSTKRIDRMGLLLLISPPGYGKTTLMEYVANRLGLIFMKINGPAIGHEVTSVDPEAANNSATREELKKLNLAFEMGDNVMLYLDDIQHCNPEFLQKFISLSDGTRKIEGVYQGQPKTYDLRSKKFCVIMAGNPYTESGEKFQIPDMLANRADIYNLGDIIGDTAHLFELSLIENALTSNPVLQQLSTRYFDDVYSLIDRVQHNAADNELKGNHSNQEIADYVSVIEKVIKIRNTVLKVNETYIASAGMEDSYRTEPSFKLQGSYRDMNKLVAKIVPIMDDKELQTLLLSHYENESQTLTSAAEANLLKYKELTDTLTEEELQRWEAIKVIFSKNNKLNSIGNQNQMSQIIAQMVDFTENIEGIKDILKKGFLK